MDLFYMLENFWQYIDGWKKIRHNSEICAISIYVLPFKKKKKKDEYDHLYITGNVRLIWLKLAESINLFQNPGRLVYISPGIKDISNVICLFLVCCIMAPLNISALATGSDI